MEVDGKKHTTSPIVTGSSVVAMKCADGVVMASDTLASYGSLARYKRTSRMYQVSNTCAIGATGEYSDFQQVQKDLDEMMRFEYCMDDGCGLTPGEIHQSLARRMYRKRSQMKPLWNSIVLAGFHDNRGVLGLVDLYGTHFESAVIATGYGLHIALPLLRKAHKPDITVAEARPIIERIMTVLYYRDARTIDTIQVTEVTKDGVNISEPFQLKTEWEYKLFVKSVRTKDDSTW